MTTSTVRYPFERRALAWSEGFSRSLCGTRCSFFVGVRSDGTVRRVYVAAPREAFDGERKARVAEGYRSWFLFHPYEEPGTGYVEWLGLPRAVAERWMGPLTADDFTDGPLDAWPESWRVVVGQSAANR